MDFLLEIVSNPLIIGILTSVLDILTMIIVYRRTGKIYFKSDPVSEDLSSLIDYHESTAKKLREITNKKE